MSKITVIPPFEIPLSSNGLPSTFYDHLSFERKSNNLPVDDYKLSKEERKKIAKVALIHAVKAGLITPIKMMPEGTAVLICDLKGGIAEAESKASELVLDLRYLPLVELVLRAYSSSRETQVQDFMGKFSAKSWARANKKFHYARVEEVLDYVQRALKNLADEAVFNEFNHLIKPSFAENAYFTSTSLVTTGAVGVGTAFLFMGNPIPIFIAAGIAAATHGDMIFDAVKKRSEQKALEDPDQELIIHSDIEIFVDYISRVEPGGSMYLYESNDIDCLILEHLIMVGLEANWVGSFAKFADKSNSEIVLSSNECQLNAVNAMIRSFERM